MAVDKRETAREGMGFAKDTYLSRPNARVLCAHAFRKASIDPVATDLVNLQYF